MPQHGNFSGPSGAGGSMPPVTECTRREMMLGQAVAEKDTDPEGGDRSPHGARPAKWARPWGL